MFAAILLGGLLGSQKQTRLQNSRDKHERRSFRHSFGHPRWTNLWDVLLMQQTRQAHLCSLLNAGHPFKIAVLLTSIHFNVPAHAIEKEFYR